ncbi:GNAT family N-acetyltransferase [Streptacidiphilus jiangxiensis]|uniref:Acetyltransferase (GNAT) domain-containing protein n=1 Tax=Streptacidiphilus jiangxiensis TaxID=235985 RepID=A0A1H7WHS8_STRJI|nr:GNAT family N-acetyltransferase [Streptacidiphilus jiangxiensis]SEM21136.1 Acetyltransferase (GNAT) domain-containing protein [Streptacidiphilus jiangxiensis]
MNPPRHAPVTAPEPLTVSAAPAEPHRRQALVATVHRTLRDDPALAPRSRAQLARACDTGRLLLATTASGETAGWLLCVPHRDGVTQELAGLYVHPAFRGRGTARLLFEAALPQARTSLCVTGPRLAQHLVREFGFRRIGPGGLSLAQWRGLFADRLRPDRLGGLLSAAPRPRALVLLRSDAGARHEPCPGCRLPVDDRQAFTATDRAFGSGALSRYAGCPHCGHLRRLEPDGGADKATHNDGPVILAEPQLPFVTAVMDSPAVARLVYRPRARWLARRHRLGQGRRVLDVGCGTGGLLRALAATGAEGEGVEVDPALAGQARRAGLAVHDGDFARFRTSDRYDAVTLFHVVEHVADPEAVLRRAVDLLVPGGVLCVETPVTGGLAGRLFGSRWFPLLPPFHRHVHSPASLAATLRRACPGARVLASRPVYLPGEYAASAALLFEAALPHPHQRRRLGAVRATAGCLAAAVAVALVLPLEVASGMLHRLLPLAGHHRVLLRKEGPA